MGKSLKKRWKNRWGFPNRDAATPVSETTPSATVEGKSSRRRMGSGAAKTQIALGKETGIARTFGVVELTALGRRST